MADEYSGCHAGLATAPGRTLRFWPRMPDAGGGLSCVPLSPNPHGTVSTPHCALYSVRNTSTPAMHAAWKVLGQPPAHFQVRTARVVTCTQFPVCGRMRPLAMHAACKGCLPVSPLVALVQAARTAVLNFRSDGIPQGPAAPCKQRGWHLVLSIMATQGAACQLTSISPEPAHALCAQARAQARASASVLVGAQRGLNDACLGFLHQPVLRLDRPRDGLSRAPPALAPHAWPSPGGTPNMQVDRGRSRQAAGLSLDAAAPRRAVAGQACAVAETRSRLLAGLLQLAADEHLV